MITPTCRTVCRYCGDALDALALRRGVDVCGSSRCRHKAAQAHTGRLRESLRVAAPEAACAQLPHLRELPSILVWLEHWEPRLVEVSNEDRDRHRTHLESVVEESTIIDRTRLRPSTADDRYPHGARLCGQCRGRCCRYGADWRAFIDLTVLRRWQDEAPGRSLIDAVEAYVSMLPPAHVEGACLYQTSTGCAMPRERRAEICNGFACDALEQVQRAAANDPESAVVAITFHHDRAERAAVIEAGATHVIALETHAAHCKAARETD